MGLHLAAVFFVLVSTPHPTAGRGQHPLITLDAHEGAGIRLKCSSERPFSQVLLLWTDGGGGNVTGTPLHGDPGQAEASSSLLLQPGSGNSASCKIIDKALGTATESSVVIADVFFPSTSPWLAAFVVILILSVFLLLAAIYKLRKNNKITARALNATCDLEKEISQLKEQITEEQTKAAKEIQEAEKEVEKARNELEFRRARSKAVPITLDGKFSHGKLIIEEKNRVKYSVPEDFHREWIAVANEGFSDKIHYWEVDVGDKSEWEVGVLSEEFRNSPKTSDLDLLGFSLWFSQGKYMLKNGDVEIPEPCGVVGIALDQDEKTLSFYDVHGKGLIGAVPLGIWNSGTFYPFFNPGPGDGWLVVRPVGIPGTPHGAS